ALAASCQWHNPPAHGRHGRGTGSGYFSLILKSHRLADRIGTAYCFLSLSEGAMTSDSALAIDYPSQSARPNHPRARVPVILMALYWAYIVGSSMAEMPMFPRFMSQMAALLV